MRHPPGLILLGAFISAVAAGAAAGSDDPEPANALAQGTAGTSACNAPVIMVVSGTTLDPARMGAYGAKIAETGVYATVGGYYLNAPQPVAVFEGDVDPRHATLMVRFPCLANAQRFWNSKTYQETIKPLRLNPSAGDYTVTVYAEADLPTYMRDKVGLADYRASFNGALEQVESE